MDKTTSPWERWAIKLWDGLPQWSLAVALAWLALTVMSAFMAATVFRTISETAEAAQVGIKMFTSLNPFEVLAGTALLLIAAKQWPGGRLSLAVAAALLVIALTTWGLLSPKIVYHFEQSQIHLDAQNDQYVQHKEQLALYHTTYKALEKIKLVLLLMWMGLALVRPAARRKA